MDKANSIAQPICSQTLRKPTGLSIRILSNLDPNSTIQHAVQQIRVWSQHVVQQNWSLVLQYVPTRGQSNLRQKAPHGGHSPVRGHPRGSKVVPLNSWGRVSY